MVNRIAAWMVESGTKDTLEGNYYFDKKEVAEKFNLSLDEIENMIKDILKELETMEAVADCSYEEDNSFYITFYLDFCRNAVIEEEDKKVDTKRQV